jgi:hypothetical protein
MHDTPGEPERLLRILPPAEERSPPHAYISRA